MKKGTCLLIPHTGWDDNREAFSIIVITEIAECLWNFHDSRLRIHKLPKEQAR